MKTKKRLIIFGLTIISGVLLSLGSASAVEIGVYQDNRQDRYVPPPPVAPVIQNQAFTYNNNPNAYNSSYRADYLNPVNNQLISTNYQAAMNPSAAINTNAGDLSTWSSTYATGNYGISQEIDQPEFAVNATDEFAEASPTDTQVSIPPPEKVAMENRTNID